MREGRRWTPLAAIVLFVLLQLVEHWSRLDAVLAWPGAVHSDLLTAHLPLSLYLHKALSHYGVLPLWNPLILAGQPLAGDPLAGLTYPLYWLTYLLPTPATYNLLLVAHLAWGGWGLYKLARAEGLSPLPGMLAGLAFAGSPRLLGQWGLGHVTLVFAVSWTPWLLHAGRLAVVGKGSQRRIARAAMAGGLLGLIASVDPRWAPPAGLMAIAYALFLIAYRHDGEFALLAWIRAAIAASVAALVAGAALLAPLWQFARQSTRWALTPAESVTLSLPPAALLQIIVPEPGVWPEWCVGVGATILLLAVVGVIRGKASGWFWLAAALSGWLLSLGGNTPIYPLARHVVPGLSLTRVPPRLSYISIVAIAVLAAHGLEGLFKRDRGPEFERRARLALAAALALIGFSSVGMITILGPTSVIASPRFGSTALLAGTLGMLLFLSLGGRGQRTVRLTGVLALVVFELLYLGTAAVEPRPSSDGQLPSPIEETASGFGGGRLFSPSYSLPQLAAARENLELADGVNPLHLRQYREFMGSAVGFRAEGYGVTLPPYPQGDPALPWSPELDLSRLGLLSVSHVISDYELAPGQLDFVGVDGGRWIYRNPHRRPRAWVQEGRDLEPQGAWRPVQAFEWTPNRIRIEAKGPGVLVLSENAFPGWRATIDGERAGVLQIGGLLRGVELPVGDHHVQFLFRPLPALGGAALSILGWLLILGSWWRAQ